MTLSLLSNSTISCSLLNTTQSGLRTSAAAGQLACPFFLASTNVPSTVPNQIVGAADGVATTSTNKLTRSIYLPFKGPGKIPVKEKMALSTKSLAGPGYIVLNVIRVMNIIGFLAVIAASVVMLVKTSTASKVSAYQKVGRLTRYKLTLCQFFFFDAVSHVVTAVTSSGSTHN